MGRVMYCTTKTFVCIFMCEEKLLSVEYLIAIFSASLTTSNIRIIMKMPAYLYIVASFKITKSIIYINISGGWGGTSKREEKQDWIVQVVKSRKRNSPLTPPMHRGDKL